VLAQIVR